MIFVQGFYLDRSNYVTVNYNIIIEIQFFSELLILKDMLLMIIIIENDCFKSLKITVVVYDK